MATLETIAEAIKEIDCKKENLRKAYDDLQSHSSLLSSISLSWSVLDAHFTQIKNELTQRFRLLESLESTQSQPTPPPLLDLSTQSPLAPAQDPSSSNPPRLEPGDSVLTQPHSPSAPAQDSSSSNPPWLKPGDSVLTQPHSPSVQAQDPSSSQPPSLDRVESELTLPELKTQFESQPEPLSSSNPLKQDQVNSVVVRPELRTLCERMDGKGLRKYINQNPKDRESIRVELPSAIRIAIDPGLMVLDAMEGFYGADDNVKGDKDPELGGIRKACVLLLEVLIGINVNIGKEVRERAKELAFAWKEKVKLDGENNLDVLGLLHLVAAYGLGCEFEKNDLVKFFVVVSKFRQSTLLCKAIDLGDKVQDLIRKLIDDRKQLLAVKYIFEFELIDKYPPVPLLKAYRNESKRLAKKIRRDGNNSLRAQNEATGKEVSALKAVIKVIEDYKLDSDYPKETLQKRIEQLQNLKASGKRPAAAAPPPAPAPKPQQQPRKLQQGANKRSRTTASVGLAPRTVAGANITVPLFQQPRAQPAGLLPENSAAYLSSPARPYGMVGSTPAVASYAGSSVGLYGLTGAHVGFSGNPNHAASHLYSRESHIPSGYYDRSTPYGGYGLPPPYHPSYYP